MWGQGPNDFTKPLGSRIIPTRVGTRKVNFFLSLYEQDHPHACGDKVVTSFVKKRGAGSSPRVWGQDDVANQVLQWVRIIPTRVGTSF